MTLTADSTQDQFRQLILAQFLTTRNRTHISTQAIFTAPKDQPASISEVTISAKCGSNTLAKDKFSLFVESSGSKIVKAPIVEEFKASVKRIVKDEVTFAKEIGAGKYDDKITKMTLAPDAKFTKARIRFGAPNWDAIGPLDDGLNNEVFRNISESGLRVFIVSKDNKISEILVNMPPKKKSKGTAWGAGAITAIDLKKGIIQTAYYDSVLKRNVTTTWTIDAETKFLDAKDEPTNASTFKVGEYVLVRHYQESTSTICLEIKRTKQK